MRSTITKTCMWIAQSAPIRWTADWHGRVNLAMAEEMFGGLNPKLSDVLPWSVNKPAVDFELFEEKARAKALELALGMCEAETIGLALERAEKIHVFFTEGAEGELDLRVRAVLAACTVAIRSEGDLQQASLIANARAFLAFLNGSISSANRAPCASAELRSGVE